MIATYLLVCLGSFCLPTTITMTTTYLRTAITPACSYWDRRLLHRSSWCRCFRGRHGFNHYPTTTTTTTTPTTHRSFFGGHRSWSSSSVPDSSTLQEPPLPPETMEDGRKYWKPLGPDRYQHPIYVAGTSLGVGCWIAHGSTRRAARVLLFGSCWRVCVCFMVRLGDSHDSFMVVFVFV